MDDDPLNLEIPPELIERIAQRTAELLAEREDNRDEPYMGIEEAARYLAAPVSRIRDLKAQGKLRHYRDGRRLLFRREDLDAVLDRRGAADGG